MFSLVQKKILKLLSINCRYSNKDIAKSIGMSEDVVRYHIERLIEKDNLAEYTAYFHFNELGYYHHHYLIRLKDVTINKLSELMDIKELFFINTSSGRYDLQLIMAHHTDEELLRIKHKIDSILKDNIADSVMLKFYMQYKWRNIIPAYDVPVKLPSKNKNPLYALNKEDWHTSRPEIRDIPTFTPYEKKTISALIEHPRASYAEIARKTGQSVESVRQQIYKFVDKGYIGNFGIFPCFGKYGYFTSYCLMNIRELDRKKLESYIQSRKNIFYGAELIGRYNVILYFIAQSSQELHQETFELRKLLKGQVIDLEVLSFDQVSKSIQFPQVLLEE